MKKSSVALSFLATISFLMVIAFLRPSTSDFTVLSLPFARARASRAFGRAVLALLILVSKSALLSSTFLASTCLPLSVLSSSVNLLFRL